MACRSAADIQVHVDDHDGKFRQLQFGSKINVGNIAAVINVGNISAVISSFLSSERYMSDYKTNALVSGLSCIL